MQGDKPRKPLIFADDPFEGLDQSFATAADGWDASYVGGYSEQRRENELLVRDGKDPVSIPRLQWIRISRGAKGDVTETDDAMMSWRRLGYRAMGQDDLDEYGFRCPDTATVAADGTIRRGDLALFFVPPERAERNRRNEKENSAKTPRRLDPADDGLELIQDKRTVKRQTSPRQVLNADS